jgi:hypothetical protein
MECDNPNGVLDQEFKMPYMNAWIDPIGNIYEVGMMGHAQFAREYIDEDDARDEEYHCHEDKHWYYAHEYLEYKGWLRIMTWTRVSSKVIHHIDHKLTKKQKDSLFDLCMKYDSDIYKEYFE